MSEYWMIWCMASSGVLFSLGGTQNKVWRRYVLPAAIIVPLNASWSVLGYVLSLSAMLHLGYGERANWCYRLFIFSGYSLPCLFLGWSWWIVLTPLLCLLMFFLSNFKPTERMFFWKAVEYFYGYLIGVSLVSTINGGHVWMR